MTLDQWLEAAPARLTRDPIWRRADYRLSAYAADLAWDDVERLARHPTTRSLADQLYRAVCSIGANIAEGYSRGSGADRVRFYEYALGSARETLDWYWKARAVLGETVVTERAGVLDQVVRLLLTAIKMERKERMGASRPRRDA